MKHKLFSAMLSACIALSSLPAAALPSASAAGEKSGECGAEGSDLTWELDDNGMLTISGTGAMADFTNYSGHTAPWDRSAVKSVVIKKGVTSIGDYAFYYCRNLSSVALPSGITSIGKFAFSGGDRLQTDVTFSLTQVDLPDTVTRIDNSAFLNLTSLTDINVPEGVEFLGSTVFTNTPWYSAIKEEAGEGSVIINDILVEGTAAEGELTLPDGIRGIAGSAFEKNEALTSITVPGTVSYIGDYAFRYCSKVKDISIGKGVASIGAQAFCGCNEVTSVTVPESVTEIGELAFFTKKLTGIEVAAKNKNYCSKDGVLFSKDVTELVSYPTAREGESYDIPSTVKRIAPYAVYNTSGLKKLTIPDGVEELGKYSLAYNADLREVSIPDSVTNIGEYALTACQALQRASVGSGVETLPSNMFYNCTAMTSVELSEGLRTLGFGAFSWCRSLERIEIPDSVETIDEQVFWCCLALEEAKLGSGVRTIGAKSFYQCHKLSGVDFPDGLEAIGEQAFYECSSIREVTIPASVTDLAYLPYGTTYSTGIFDGCTSLEKATFLGDIPTVSNYMFNNCTSLKSVNIPDSVTRIGVSAFAGCSSLADIRLPNGLVYINDNAFKGCVSLTSVELPSSTYYIGKRAFCNCCQLSSVLIPGSVYTIKEEAFSGCTSLTSVQIPETVTTIGDDAFETFGTKSKYTYDIFALSEVGRELYDGCSAIIYIRTENPDPDSFVLSTGMPYSTSTGKYDDITYKNTSSQSTFRAVEGGYVLAFTPSVSGTFDCMITETDSATGKKNIASQFTLTVNDYDTAYYAWMDDVIASNTDDTMTNFEKMSAVSSYLLKNFKYLTNTGGNLVSLASEPNSPYFRAHHWDSYISPSALCQFAIRIGGFDKIDDLYSNYAQYGYSWSNGHYLCYCEADGVGKFYQACPVTSTGKVDIKPIDFTDDSQLYQLNGLKKKTIAYTPLTIIGKADSDAEYYAQSNGITFKEASDVRGDVNIDGALTIADAVLLQKWLLGARRTKLPDWKAADLCEDERIDTFDLCVMKKLLTAKK